MRGVDPKDNGAIEDGKGWRGNMRKERNSNCRQGGLTKNPARAAAKMAKGEEVQRGLGRKPSAVILRASLEENGKRIFGLSMNCVCEV